MTISTAMVKPAGPLRRLGAMFYDALLVIAIIMVTTLPFLPFANGKVLVPAEVSGLAYVYWLWEVIMLALYFCFFWTRNGRTLGMQAWHLRIERIDQKHMQWRDALVRMACAVSPWVPAFITMSIAEHTALRSVLMPIGVGLLGIGFLNYVAAYWTADRRAWHERWLKTRIVVLK